jgi:sodium/proline symporter
MLRKKIIPGGKDMSSVSTGSISAQVLFAMVAYIVLIIGVGLYFSRQANKSSDYYFIGGRGLGPWVAAMSAEASDMSGWLLMGLPGVAYWCGLSDAAWTAVGLAIGTYINWLVVAKPLRRYSVVAGNAITVPDFFNNRFRSKDKTLLMLSSLLILIFFAVYAGSCFVTFGKLFSQLFGFSYRPMMILGALFVIAYTLLGGFLAESASDFIQGIVMIFALVTLLVVGTTVAGGPSAIIENIKSIPGFLSFTSIASPAVTDGAQQVAGGLPVFGPAGKYGFLTIISTMSWGLGYFGMPQVLLRFFAIRKASEIKKSRRIATIWCVIAMTAAVMLGLIGRVLFPVDHLTSSAAENILITISTSLLPPLLVGIIMSGILAAAMSSSDSYLLIAASAFSKNIYKSIIKKDAKDSEILILGRVALVIVSLVGVFVAFDENSAIFVVVSFAWAGFGAAFGPLMLFSLFWKRLTYAGAVAGVLGGGGMVFLWKLVLKPLGGVWGIYELLPAFLFSCLAIVVVSLLTPPPGKGVIDDFEAAKVLEC